MWLCCRIFRVLYSIFANFFSLSCFPLFSQAATRQFAEVVLGAAVVEAPLIFWYYKSQKKLDALRGKLKAEREARHVPTENY